MFICLRTLPVEYDFSGTVCKLEGLGYMSVLVVLLRTGSRSVFNELFQIERKLFRKEKWQ